MSTTIEEGYLPGCIGRVAQLHADYYSRSNGFGAPFEAKVAQDFSAFCLAYTQGRDGLWLAKNPSIQGSIAIDGSKGSEHGAHLRWFITSDALRGQGIGRILLSRALAFADEAGHSQVHLWTFAGLDAARHLYESHGFKLVEEHTGSTWGKVVLEQHFVRGAGGSIASLTPRSSGAPTAGHLKSNVGHHNTRFLGRPSTHSQHNSTQTGESREKGE